MFITIDSRGAGEGKTTTSIYPKILNHVSSGDKVLVVVPSIKLQKQYATYFAGVIDFTVINSEDSANVSDRIIQTMMLPTSEVICITSAAWLNSQLSPNVKQHWHLIVDEAITPFRSYGYDNAKMTKQMIPWSAITVLGELQSTGYNEIQFLEQNDSWFNEIASLRDLSSTNWQAYCKIDSYNKLCNTDKGRATFLQELKISHIEDYASVHIAAAAFEYTFMSYWLKAHNKKTYTPEEHKFIQQPLPIDFHCPEDLDWSLRKQKTTDLITQYKNYVYGQLALKGKTEKLIVVKNNSTNSLGVNDHQIDHNPHGMNDLMHHTAVSLESALNFSSSINEWLTETFGMNDKEITRAHSAYLFYQIMMRTCLRVRGNTKRCDVFLLDHRTYNGLLDFVGYGNVEVIVMPLALPPKPPKKISRAKSPAERMRLKRQRDRLPKITSVTPPI